MTEQEGKDFLQQCLYKCKVTNDIDSLIVYKVGNKREARGYQSDTIITEVKPIELRSEASFVVKCFIHLDLYVAWNKEVGRGNGKFVFYKKDLIEMYDHPTCTFQEIVLNNHARAYIFREEKGTKQFIKQHLVPNREES